jgi:hypothetical protein
VPDGQTGSVVSLENLPIAIYMPSRQMVEDRMAAEIHRLRDRAGETEKITINLGYVDLGHIDLLVQEGFYSNRTDFIRTAIRNRLAAAGIGPAHGRSDLLALAG